MRILPPAWKANAGSSAYGSVISTPSDISVFAPGGWESPAAVLDLVVLGLVVLGIVVLEDVVIGCLLGNWGSPETNSVTVRTTRDLPAGAEITTSYRSPGLCQ